MSSRPIRVCQIRYIDKTYTYIAFNHDGLMVGFFHPPVRDYKQSVWVDSTDGSYGEIIPCLEWETSVKRTSDMSSNRLGIGSREPKKPYENAKVSRDRFRFRTCKICGLPIAVKGLNSHVRGHGIAFESYKKLPLYDPDGGQSKNFRVIKKFQGSLSSPGAGIMKEVRK